MTPGSLSRGMLQAFGLCDNHFSPMAPNLLLNFFFIIKNVPSAFPKGRVPRQRLHLLHAVERDRLITRTYSRLLFFSLPGNTPEHLLFGVVNVDIWSLGKSMQDMHYMYLPLQSAPIFIIWLSNIGFIPICVVKSVPKDFPERIHPSLSSPDQFFFEPNACYLICFC